MDVQPPAVRHAVLRINARAWGISTGLLLGLGVFLATNLLVVRGGVNVGQHLQLLGIYFPGYTVTFVGSLIGFVYAFVVGYGVGRIIGWIYALAAGFPD
ncbi:MAG TPA: hypothetical protein VK912_06705 [Longimicrobiales bacterium]|nr:hypothetical protein [Longimicrobiales bacterium]